MKLILLSIAITLVLPFSLHAQAPSLDCVTITTTSGLTVFDLNSCDNTYKFADQQNKTARQLSLEIVQEECAKTSGSTLTSKGSNIYECRVPSSSSATQQPGSAAPAASAKVYSPLVDLSNAGQGNDVQTFEKYINFLYGMSIAVAALLAVIKIIIAGAKYMMSDVIGNKEDAKNDIQGAVLGLLIIISAVVILELINPTLVRKEIKFDEFQSPRGVLNALAVQTVGGQTAQQHSAALFEGVDACVTRSNPTMGQSGQTTVVVANASACTNAKEQLLIFGKNCESNGGRVVSAGTGTGIASCGTAFDGATETAALASEIAAIKIINSTATIGSEFVTQVGTVVTTNVAGACDKQVATLPASQRRSAHPTCVSSIISTLDNQCDGNAIVLGSFGWYGKFDDSNTGAVTCTVPKKKSVISSLTEAFLKYQADDKSRQYYDLNSLSVAEEKLVCEKYAGGKYFDDLGKINTCAFY